MTKKMNEMNKNVVEMAEIAKRLNEVDFVKMVSLLKDYYTSEEIKYIRNSFALKQGDVSNSITVKNKSSISIIYQDEINKINRLLRRPDIIEKVGGLRVMLYGKTGTGKTSLVNEIAQQNKDYKFKEINLENFISSKMGQTQVNLFKFLDDINKEAEGTNMMIFFDELDSIVGNRSNEDLGERKKIAATFIKILDKLDKNIVIFAATNFVDEIDDSIKRRFSFHLQTRGISTEQFIDFFDREVNGTLKRKKQYLVENVVEELKISDLQSFINHFKIEKEFSPSLEAFPEFLKYFSKSIKNIDDASERARKKAGLNEKI